MEPYDRGEDAAPFARNLAVCRTLGYFRLESGEGVEPARRAIARVGAELRRGI